MANTSKARSDHHRPSLKQRVKCLEAAVRDDPIGVGVGAALGSAITAMVVHPTTTHLWAVVMLAALAMAYNVGRKTVRWFFLSYQ